MKSKRQGVKKEAQKTPLDYWDETIDPATMSGDYWAEARLEDTENEHDPSAIFMHPQHNSAIKVNKE